MQGKINQFINVLIAECWNEILTDENFHFTHEEMSDWLWTYEESFNDLFAGELMETEAGKAWASSDTGRNAGDYEQACERITVKAIDLALEELDRRVSDIRETMKALFKKHTET